MTVIKLCGLSRPCDIEEVNRLKPEYIGFVFVPESRRYVAPEKAAQLKRLLIPGIRTVGVFADEDPAIVAGLLNNATADLAQLHGHEDESYIRRLRKLTGKPLIRAFRVETEKDAADAGRSTADYVLLDSGAGTGTVFDWQLIRNMKRPYFLAGGLSTGNVEMAVQMLRPYAVDVSSGIETGGFKDKTKMAAFVAAVRKGDRL